MSQKYSNPDCTLCPLNEAASHVCIMGEGYDMADIMVVLDAPGFNEDRAGAPIAGKSQTFLNSLLKDAGINPKKVYFTNAVKCGPPQGYKLKVSEMKACNPYLQDEIRRVNPTYILLMGANAHKAVVGKGAITQVHGQVVEHEGRQYMSVFSPGIAHRDPGKLALLQQDLARFGKMTKGQSFDLPDLEPQIVRDIDQFEAMIEDIRTSRVVSVDLETTGLSRFHDHITIVGVGTPQEQYILPLLDIWTKGYHLFMVENAHQRIVEIIAEACQGRDVVTQNGKFDNLFLREKFGVRVPITFDTQIASAITDENTPKGLNYRARTLLGVPDWDIDLDVKKGKTQDLEVLAEYAAYDLYFTLRLYYYYKKEFRSDPTNRKIFEELLMPVFKVYEDVQHEGVWIKQDQFHEVDEYLNGKLKEIDEQLDNYLEEVLGTTEPDGIKVNWKSTKFVGYWLYEALDLPIVEKTPTGNPATGVSVLKALKDEHPSIPLILERRGVQQQLSFFVDGWKQYMHRGRIYPNFNIHVTVTGRTSSNKPNLQQVPRDPRIRTLVGAPPGWTLAEIDYSQVELRVVGELSRDPNMMQVFINNFDIHANTASSLSHDGKVTKELRESAKAVNFGFVYGMGHKKFKDYAWDSYGLKISEKEALAWRTRFFEEYAQLPVWHDKQRRLVNRFGQVRNLIGRLRRLPEAFSSDWSKRAEAERQAINSPVQSFASDMMLMSLIEVHKKLPQDKVKIIGSVHDAGLYIIKDDYLNEFIPQIKEIMEKPELLKSFKVDLTVPLKADVDIGPWGNAKEWTAEKIIIPNRDGSVEFRDREEIERETIVTRMEIEGVEGDVEELVKELHGLSNHELYQAWNDVIELSRK